MQENYDINTAQYLSSALKDMFRGGQEIMNTEFDSSMDYFKYDKTNYQNGTTKKN